MTEATAYSIVLGTGLVVFLTCFSIFVKMTFK